MSIHPIVFAVPVYALLIGLEIWLTWHRGSETYDTSELLANAGSGLGQLVTDIFIGLMYQLPYIYVFQHARLFTFTVHDPFAWVSAFVGVDFAFYWQHRMAHGVNFLWAAHVVHHQPERYNLSVALRTPWFAGLTNWVYYLPLAILGIPVNVFIPCIALNLAYQFYLHTCLIRRMRLVEGILNTPSHHRVHHGKNPEYLDRNFAGVFIIWDRMFGTFQPEQTPVQFGTTTPYRSMNGVWANFDYPWLLWLRSRRFRHFKNSLYVWFAPPGWQAEGETDVAPPTMRCRNQTRGVVLYGALSSLITLIASALLIARQDSLSLVERLIGVGLVVWSLAAVGGLLDGRHWAKRCEITRVLVVSALSLWFWKLGRFA